MANELSIELCYEDIRAAMVKLGFVIEVNYFFHQLVDILLYKPVIPVSQCLLFTSRWRRNPCRPLTQRMTVLCSDMCTTVSSLLHESPRVCISRIKPTISIQAHHQLLSHLGKKMLTDLHDTRGK